MTETSEMEMISRRGLFRVLGLATLGLAATPTLLTVSDAGAQGFIAIPAQTPQTGTERRQERRTERTGQRQKRRTNRTEQRQERRGKRKKGRTVRREKPSGTTPTPKTTAPSPQG
jgi:hypothetical protein